jgi:hypothetical protein
LAEKSPNVMVIYSVYIWLWPTLHTCQMPRLAGHNTYGLQHGMPCRLLLTQVSSRQQHCPQHVSPPTVLLTKLLIAYVIHAMPAGPITPCRCLQHCSLPALYMPVCVCVCVLPCRS